MKKEISAYIESIKSSSKTLPAIMDESTFFEIISGVTGKDIYSFQALTEEHIFSIFVYSVADGKKEFSVDTIRNEVIPAVSLAPFGHEKNIYVLRDFDTG